MRIEIDISGQIQQLNYDSALGFWRDNGVEKSVYLKSEVKKEVIRKYKGQVTNLIEMSEIFIIDWNLQKFPSMLKNHYKLLKIVVFDKLHCILIYYCIKDHLDNANEIKICRDVNIRRLKNLLPLLFKNHNYLEGIKVEIRKHSEQESKAHRIALKTFRMSEIFHQFVISCWKSICLCIVQNFRACSKIATIWNVLLRFLTEENLQPC